MECIEARALKSSFLKEIGMKSTQQTLFEDLFSVNGIDNVVNVSTSAEFSVDDLLDFSDKEDFHNSGDGCFQEKDFLENNSTISSDFPTAGEMVCFPAGEVQFPVDNMESLEWLSHIVDDSSSDHSLFFSPATTGKFSGTRPHPVIPSFTVLGLSYPVPRNYRTKRSKKTGRGWSTTLTDSSSTSSSSSSSYGSTVTSPDPVQLAATKKKPGSWNSSGSSEHRCSHCQVQRTPQWRTGPLGPKTLCNACGVRFKSGRLFPEYRPACSPTFSDDIHSNSHRKVLEMRKKREVEPEFRSGFDGFCN